MSTRDMADWPPFDRTVIFLGQGILEIKKASLAVKGPLAGWEQIRIAEEISELRKTVDRFEEDFNRVRRSNAV